MEQNILTKANTRLFNRYFILVWLVSLTVTMGQSMMNSTSALYIDHLGYPETLSGLANLFFSVMAVLARLLGGYVCDKKSRRLVMICACAIFSLSVFLFGCCTGVLGLMLFRSLHGVGFSAGNTATNTVAVDVTPIHKRKEGLGIFFVAVAGAFALGSPIVLGLSAGGSYMPVFITCAAFLALGTVLSIFCNYEKNPAFRQNKEEPNDTARGFRRYFEPKAIPAGLILLMLALGSIGTVCYALLYAEKMSFSNAGLFFSIAAVLMLVCNLSQAWLVKKLGTKTVLCLAFGAFALTLFLQALTGSRLVYFMMGAGFGIQQGICWPVGIDIAVDGVPYARRGAANSTACLMTDIGAGVGGMIFGSVIAAAGYPITFFLLGLTQVGGVVLSLVLIRKKRSNKSGRA